MENRIRFATIKNGKSKVNIITYPDERYARRVFALHALSLRGDDGVIEFDQYEKSIDVFYNDGTLCTATILQ